MKIAQGATGVFTPMSLFNTLKSSLKSQPKVKTIDEIEKEQTPVWVKITQEVPQVTKPTNITATNDLKSLLGLGSDSWTKPEAKRDVKHNKFR